MIVTSPKELGNLLNLVHDCWFNVDQLAFDAELKTVEIYLARKKANLTKGSGGGIRLVIKNAQDIAVNDTEEVCYYDINQIKFDAASGCVTITGGIPLTIEVKVSALNIEAKPTVST